MEKTIEERKLEIQNFLVGKTISGQELDLVMTMIDVLIMKAERDEFERVTEKILNSKLISQPL